MRLTATEQESLRIEWSDLLVVLVRAYSGKRTTMWERLPNMMASCARQTSQLDRWWTMLLRALQIEQHGSASSASSLSSVWPILRQRIRGLGEDASESERYALRLLRDELATITALARVRWEQIKEMTAASRASKTEEG